MQWKIHQRTISNVFLLHTVQITSILLFIKHPLPKLFQISKVYRNFDLSAMQIGTELPKTLYTIITFPFHLLIINYQGQHIVFQGYFPHRVVNDIPWNFSSVLCYFNFYKYYCHCLGCMVSLHIWMTGRQYCIALLATSQYLTLNLTCAKGLCGLLIRRRFRSLTSYSIKIGIARLKIHTRRLLGDLTISKQKQYKIRQNKGF